MFRFLLDSEYRRLYNQLEGMELFSNLLPIKLQAYQQYFHHLVIIDPSLTKQLDTIPTDKLNPIRTLKILTFIHCWLQATCVIQDPQPVINFINVLLTQVSQTAGKTRRNRSFSEKRTSRSSFGEQSGQKYKQLEMSKELYLLEEVCKPYITYLQKLISRFDFYNSLKKNFIKPMNHSQIWVLVNLFHCISKVVNNIPTICKLIRKSYRPVAEVLASTFSQDIANFYPKLYKYSYNEVNKVKSMYFQMENERGEEYAYKSCLENVDLMVNLLEEVGGINKVLNQIYDEPVVQNLYNIYMPKMIDVQGGEFEFIRQLESIKKRGFLTYVEDQITPKFKTMCFSRNSNPSMKTQEGVIREEQQEESKEVANVKNIFRDISNAEQIGNCNDKNIVAPMRKRERERSADEENQEGHKRVLTLSQISRS